MSAPFEDCVFPQTECDDEKFNRTGGLTKHELAAIIFAAHETAMADLFAANGILKAESHAAMRKNALQAGIDAATVFYDLYRKSDA